jgi:hypothetical protein
MCFDLCYIKISIAKTKKGGDRMEKARIVIEVSEEDYESLETLKRVLGVTWRDFLIGGAVYWVDRLGLEEQIEKIRVKCLKQTKKEEV